MKKLAILAVFAAAAVAASATEITVSGSRDSTQNNVTGYSLVVAQPVATGLTVKGKFENLNAGVGKNVDRYLVGASYDVAKVGPVTLAGLGNVGYTEIQSTGAAGTYFQFGGQASAAVPFIKNTSASLTLLRQLGTSAVTAGDHSEAMVGVSYALTKDVSLKASATFYDNVPGNKFQFGAAYTF